jgi:spermidine/putrescine-binding protein
MEKKMTRTWFKRGLTAAALAATIAVGVSANASAATTRLFGNWTDQATATAELEVKKQECVNMNGTVGDNYVDAGAGYRAVVDCHLP